MFCLWVQIGLCIGPKIKKGGGGKYPSLFKPPKDLELFKEWKKKVPKRERNLTHNDHIFSLYFIEDINRFEEVKLKFGTQKETVGRITKTQFRRCFQISHLISVTSN